MLNEVLSQYFYDIFKTHPEGISSAPGRVNIIGEFTDYNDGFVLPCALEFRTQVAYKRRDDKKVVVHSLQYQGERDTFSTDERIAKGDSQWGNYVRAVIFSLKAKGAVLSGMDLLVQSDVPQGAGLSSSAALEVAIGGAFNAAFNLGFSPTALALIGQYAENEFMDCQCGIMDQLVSAKGESGNALFIDCKDLSTQLVSMPKDLVLLIINSNFPRKLVESDYNQRREDCIAVSKAMRVSTLREADMSLLDNIRSTLTDTQYRRAKHVISENQRVLESIEALRKSNIEKLSELMSESHASLRNDFEVTVPATNWIVDTCSNLVGDKGAVRQTGGGFGGAVVCLCKPDKVDEIIRTIGTEYQLNTGLHADVFRCVAGDGLTVTHL